MNHRFHLAAVFDMDGLLIDSETIARRYWIEAASEFGYTLTEEHYSQLVGRKVEDSFKILREIFGEEFPAETIRERKTVLREKYISEHGLPVKPGARAVLQLLKENRIPLALATSTEKSRAKASLLHAGLTAYFPIMVTGDQVKHGKPAPDIYLQTAKLLDVDSNRCLAFEDSPFGVQAAHSARMSVIMVPDCVQPTTKVKGLTTEVLKSLTEAPALLDKYFSFEEGPRRQNVD